ncbi:MAG: DNA cytosine methyltransferase [Oligoflexia bacterium]|nr:DNA cytosine methyltransferase [Oligoflexia bacterium]MBF0366794.1 DNA cytosine methyltransferase [Oligoflexia bacterium]
MSTSASSASTTSTASTSQFNCIDLFCGAGGLSLGLEMAGFKNVFSIDADVGSINTIRANYPETVALCEPIEFLNEEKLKKYIGDKKIHLIAGGPPCQGFSTIGKGDPNDQKNTLFRHFIRMVEIVRPSFVLFENVTGLVAKKNQFVVDAIAQSFDQIGYKLHIRVLESQHYGVPQKRKRTLIVACKKEFHFAFPAPTCDTYHNSLYIPPKTLGGALLELESYVAGTNIKDELHDVKKLKITKEIDRSRLKHIPEGACIRYQEDEERYLPKELRLKVDWKNLRENRLRENHYHRLSRNKPSPTINTMNHHYYHPTECRPLSVREFSVLQSFPPNYIFKGNRRSIMRQIGNAVPPLMAKAIGAEIVRALSGGVGAEARLLKGHIAPSTTESVVADVRAKAFIYSERKQKRRVFCKEK